MRTGEKTAPPAYPTPTEGNTSPHLLSRAQTLCYVLLRCNHNFCVHSISNMPLRVSSRISAQVNISMARCALELLSAQSAHAPKSVPLRAVHAAETLRVSLKHYIRHMRCYRRRPILKRGKSPQKYCCTCTRPKIYLVSTL